ncbi:MAG: hypothetical protein A3F42_05150 [Gammaproteobacteria bacterium RIFCSPHIGHO2_12_FULL_37_34]|nr:MAG: hypothetical protein A3F42_05150 [Gammaproteobacteria bacterium RIFCSPHIGHO2_12_FULL_37_34]
MQRKNIIKNKDFKNSLTQVNTAHHQTPPLKFHSIKKSEVNRIVIVRNPTYFSVDTIDNPYMAETIHYWERSAEDCIHQTYENNQINPAAWEILKKNILMTILIPKKRNLSA